MQRDPDANNDVDAHVVVPPRTSGNPCVPPRPRITRAQPGDARATPSTRARMYHRFRLPILVAAVLFMIGSLLVCLHGLPAEALEEPPPRTEAQRQADREQIAAYALRLRTDAFEHLYKAEYEVALSRFDEAKEWDPTTDRLSPTVRQARREIAENLGLDEPEPEPSSSPKPPSPQPGAAHE
jgi:hypothetical protein